MNLQITNIEINLMSSIIAFCNLHYFNYQRYNAKKDDALVSNRLIIYDMDSEEVIMLLTKILKECDKYDFGTIQIM